MNIITKALAILDLLTPSVRETSDFLIGAVLAALTEARTAARQHWHDAAAAACDTMQAASGKLTMAMTPSWREHLPANADWQILVDTCGNALRTTGNFSNVMVFHTCCQAGSGIC